MKRKGFSLIEILVVIAILSVLITFSITALTSVTRSGRDGRRKADLEDVRTAIEQWRSDKGSYPNTATLTINNCTGGSLIDASGNIYLQTTPKDPLCNNTTYYYSTTGQDYTLAAALETGPTADCQGLTDACGGGTIDCNYCLGPYGKK